MAIPIIAQSDMELYQFFALIIVATALLLVLIFVLLTRGERMLDAAVRWTRRTFGRAGDPCPHCASFCMEARCATCGLVFVMAPSYRIAPTVRSTAADVVDITRERARLEALATMPVFLDKQVH